MESTDPGSISRGCEGEKGCLEVGVGGIERFDVVGGGWFEIDSFPSAVYSKGLWRLSFGIPVVEVNYP